jgi:hypothetical protein
MLLRWALPTDAQALISTGMAAGQHCPMNSQWQKNAPGDPPEAEL